MLISLHIKNMALIREEEVEFGPGLNILTGETGAGKSIIIGSVNVALGRGKFSDYVPENVQQALCELVFETDSVQVRRKLDEAGISMEDGQVVISRKYQKGRSISRVNGESVTIGFVRELAAELIDIHGQHEHQSLLQTKYHLDLLDRFAQSVLDEPARAYADTYARYRSVRRELDQAVTDEREQARQLDLVRYEIREIDEAHLTVGEDEQLEADFRRMEHGQKIADALSQVQQLVSAGDGASDALSRAVREMNSVSAYDAPLEELAGSLSQIEDLLNDFDRSLSGYIDDFAYDEQSFYETGQRLDLINHLKARYGRSISAVLAYKDARQEMADRLENYESYLKNLRQREHALHEQLLRQAAAITQIRTQAAGQLEVKITEALRDLNFLDAQFCIDFRQSAEPGSRGMDEICFMISTNPGMPPRALQETASGGELSRIMLAVKAVMADQDVIGTLIFDEIDTGISGRTAQKVSEKMALIARSHQVICITHLAQIAAMADHHYVITKSTDGSITTTQIRLLAGEECADELGRIIGGVSITDAVMDSAREMRRMAISYKESRK